MSTKKRTRRNSVLTVIEVLLLGIFLFALFQAGKTLYDYHKGDAFYEESQNTYLTVSDSSPEAEESRLGFRVDLTRLQQANPDVKGWIYIPDTEVSYPLLWSGDDDTYLRHTYTGEYNVFGSIFFSELSNPNLTDQHTLIYGHNTKNGAMFGGLKKYQDQSYFESHPSIYLIMGDRTYQYKIVSCFTAETSDDVYILSYDSQEDFRQWFTEVVLKSEVDPGTISIIGTEQVLTLSTCTSRTKTERFTVNAILQDSWENQEAY